METKDKVETVFTKFPCPKCGVYYEPYLTRHDGKAMLECPEHGLFETSIATSKHFRTFCAKLGSAPNRSPTYYTSSEDKIRKYLLHWNLIEGLDFMHNCRIGPFVNENNRKMYYWCDFVVPKYKLVIECSPSIWHTRWNRQGADDRKKEHLAKLGWKMSSLDEKELSKTNKIRIDRPLKLRELDILFEHDGWIQWQASLWLGEGSLQIKRCKSKRGGHQMNLSIKVYNSDEAIIDKFIEFTHWKKWSVPYIRKGKNLIEFMAYTGGWRKTISFLNRVYPFLVGRKKKGTELLFELYKMRKGKKNSRYTPEELRKYGEIRRALLKPSMRN